MSSEPVLYEYLPAPGETKKDALAVREPSIMDILAMSVERGAPIDTIERIVALKSRLDAEKAEAEFNDAMNKAQSEMSHVRKDCENPQTRSRYTSYPALDRAIRPTYTKFGFAVSYSPTDCPLPEHIRMLAYVTRGGYTRIYQCDMPADGKGAKGGDVMTKTHAHGAAHEYSKRYLLKDIFNIVTGDEPDSDGNETPQWLTEYLDAMKDATDVDALKKLYFEAKAKAQRANSSLFVRMIEEAKDKRKAEIQ